MDPLHWFQLLTPLAITVSISNLLAGLPFNKAQIPRLSRKLAFIGYSGIALGWMIMRHALTLTPVSSLMHFSIIGWLLLMPSITLIGIIFLWRLFCKNNFLIFLIKNIFKLVMRISEISSPVVSKFLLSIFTRPKTSKLSHEETPDISQSDIVGIAKNPNVYSFDGKATFGSDKESIL